MSFETIGIVGENAQGKTNLLEALYLLSCGESWRSAVDTEFIRFEESFARIDGNIGDDQINLSLIVERSVTGCGAKKGYLVNDVRRKKETFVSYFPTVLFHPEDLVLVIGSPSQRRKVLDDVLIQAYPHYSQILTQYGKIVTARNRVLDAIREGTAKTDQLVYWTDMLLKLGAEIYQFRYRFFDFAKLCEGKYTFNYMPKIVCATDPNDEKFVHDIRQMLKNRIEENTHKEIMSATSQYGPHKDDFGFCMDDRDIALYGSRGEQRAATFAFKKIQLQYVEKIRETRPVLLLDDVFSEFDRVHREQLADLTHGYQTIVSGTEDRFFTEEAFKFEKIFRVKQGQIES
jgi:DNA replication and repair protein RecF